MSKSARPTIQHIQELTTLVCECIELGNDPLLWRRHLASGVQRLVPDSVSLIYEIECPGTDKSNGGLQPILIDHGWLDDASKNSFYSYLQSGKAATNPLLHKLMNHKEDALSIRAYEVEPAESWRALEVADYMTDAHVAFDCYTQAKVALSGRRDVLTVHRHSGHDAWVRRDLILLKLLFDSISPHLGLTLRPIGGPSILDLPRRTLGVLDGYFRGLSSKQVAAERNLSLHTVREYSKLIHKHFGVESRGELQAYLAGVSHRHMMNPLFEI